MECHADVTGTYCAIMRFLYDLEKDPMGLQVQGVELTSRDDTGQQISLGLELSGLLLPPPPIHEASYIHLFLSFVSGVRRSPLGPGDQFDGAPSRNQGRDWPGAGSWNEFRDRAKKIYLTRPRSGRAGTAAERPAPDSRPQLHLSRHGGRPCVLHGRRRAGRGYLKVGDTINGFKVMRIPGRITMTTS